MQYIEYDLFFGGEGGGGVGGFEEGEVFLLGWGFVVVVMVKEGNKFLSIF